jgi:serine/threonine protein kinase
MKSINKDDIVKKDQIEHTKTEKMILEHVNHPFLVNLAFAFQTPSKLYFIMQFMSIILFYFRGRRAFPTLVKRKKIPRKTSQILHCSNCIGFGPFALKGFHLP